MYSAYSRDAHLVLPSPNASESYISQSDADTDLEYTLFEGSTTESYVWSSSASSQVAREVSPEGAPAQPHTILDVSPRIPLLRFFASLLAVDEETLTLLEHPQFAHSPLFPGPALVQAMPEMKFSLRDYHSRREDSTFYVLSL